MSRRRSDFAQNIRETEYLAEMDRLADQRRKAWKALTPSQKAMHLLGVVLDLLRRPSNAVLGTLSADRRRIPREIRRWDVDRHDEYYRRRREYLDMLKNMHVQKAVNREIHRMRSASSATSTPATAIARVGHLVDRAVAFFLLTAMMVVITMGLFDGLIYRLIDLLK